MTTFKSFTKRKNTHLLLIIACSLGTFVSNGQSRKYSIIYSDNVKGSSAIFGNTLLQIMDGDTVNTTKMNGNRVDGNSDYGNNRENLQYADVDGNSGAGTVTRNSSSADLVLPGGANTIKLARLYWGGFILNNDFDLADAANKTVKIRKGTAGTYADVTAVGIDKEAVNSSSTQYQAYADITAFIQNNGAGTYEVGNVPLTTGAFSISGANGGWYVVVVYENQNLNYNSIRVYDGFQKVYTLNSLPSITEVLTGLNVPSGVLQAGDATMGVVAWEGDANLKTDFLKINGNIFSNATNPANNPWNGTITNNGVHVTAKNPDYTNQMGLDIDQFNVGVGYGISPGDNSVNLEFGAEQDRYFPGAFTFTIKMNDPGITLAKTVSDQNNDNRAEANEVLTYTLKGKNTGIGNANYVTITDTLSSAVTYLPNSLNVIYSPGVTPGIKTDGAGNDNAEYMVNGSAASVKFRLGMGSDGTTGGSLSAADSFQVQFKAVVNDPGAGNPVPSIINVARIRATSDAGVQFVDDATAIINAEAGPLPITLLLFNGLVLSGSQVRVDWATSMEINCSRYEVERSVDGKNFSTVSTIAGNGTTASLHSYFTVDNISDATGYAVYYRLKQVDLNNKAAYSKVIAVKLKTSLSKISISPNPFTTYLNINFESAISDVIVAKLINGEGQEVVSKSVQVSKGLNYISLPEPARLAPGSYFLQFITTTETITRKITKP